MGDEDFDEEDLFVNLFRRGSHARNRTRLSIDDMESDSGPDDAEDCDRQQSPSSPNSRISHISQLSQLSTGTVRVHQHGHRRTQTSMALDLEGLHSPSASPG